jgi:DNA-binding transcriptional ArsR family regulator
MAETPDEGELIGALRHPLRRKILRTLANEKELSPSQLSDLLDEPLSNVSYHVRILAKSGAVKLVDTQPVRGSIQHFYAMTIDEPWVLAALGM